MDASLQKNLKNRIRIKLANAENWKRTELNLDAQDYKMWRMRTNDLQWKLELDV